jgi:hypothetical protein
MVAKLARQIITAPIISDHRRGGAVDVHRIAECCFSRARQIGGSGRVKRMPSDPERADITTWGIAPRCRCGTPR